jgi:hypothetical protein
MAGLMSHEDMTAPRINDENARRSHVMTWRIASEGIAGPVRYIDDDKYFDKCDRRRCCHR